MLKLIIENSSPAEIVIGLVFIVFVLGAPALNKWMDAVLAIKDKLMDRKANSIVDAALAADGSLRDELLRKFDHASAEHDEFRGYFDNDKKAIDEVRRDVKTLRKRVDGLEIRDDNHDSELKDRAKGEMVVLSAIKAILNKEIGMGTTANLVDAVEMIDSYLIEGRTK